MLRNACYVALPIATVGGAVYLGFVSTQVMREDPTKAANHMPIGRKLKNVITTQGFSELKSKGILVVDNVLSSIELNLARDEVNTLLSNDQFEANDNKDNDTRNDSVYWISESIGNQQISTLGPGLLHALRCCRSIPLELTSNGYKEAESLGVPYSNQLACYDGNGAHYIPHRDTPELQNGLPSHPLRWLLQPGLEERKFTIILYLNQEIWQGGDDSNMTGNLRCYMHADMNDMTGRTATEILEISPIGGRMVIFDSTKILHEVVPTASRRTVFPIDHSFIFFSFFNDDVNLYFIVP